jgi:hypothetical protein
VTNVLKRGRQSRYKRLACRTSPYHSSGLGPGMRHRASLLVVPNSKYCLRDCYTDVPCRMRTPTPRSRGLGPQTMPFHRPAEAGTYARSRTLPATVLAAPLP